MSVREPQYDCEHTVDAAAYVLGALEYEDRFREHLGSCAACRAEVAELQLVADRLPGAVAPIRAPDALRDRVMATARSEAELLRAAGSTADQPPRRARWRTRRISFAAAGVAIAASAAIAAVIAVSVGGSSGGERVIQAQWVTPGASASLHQVGGHSELVVSGMPQPPAGKIYEVWLAHASGSPQPTNALFGVSHGGSASVAVPASSTPVKEVLVTAEPVGGSAHPTSEPVIRVATSA